MTTHPQALTRSERRALDIYESMPIEDGDAVLLLDGETVLELRGLADHQLPAELIDLIRHCDRALLAIARRGSDLTQHDRELGALLRQKLVGVEVPPVQALPAA